MRIHRFLVLVLLAALALPAVMPHPALAQGDCATPLPLAVGSRARVESASGAPNNVRAQPNTTAQVAGIAQPGTEFEITGGPVCAGGFNWWGVRYVAEGRLITGWMAEGRPGDYWIEAVGTAGAGSAASGGAACATPLAFAVDDRARVTFTTGRGNRVRNQPSLSAGMLVVAPEGSEFFITGGPTCADGYNWWEVSLIAQSTTGWMAEGLPGAYWMERSPTAGLAPPTPDPGAVASSPVIPPLPGPPAVLPAGLQTLRLLTLDNDGAVGIYESGRGWRSLASFGENATFPRFSPDGTRFVIVADGQLYVPDTAGIAFLHNFDWQTLTGDATLHITGAVWSRDGTALLVTVSEDESLPFPRQALYRVGLEGPPSAQVLFPLGETVSLQGPSGAPPHYILTSTQIVALTPQGWPGAVLHTYQPASTYSEYPYIPQLTWLTGGAAFYAVMPQGAGDAADTVAWQITPEGAVLEVTRLPGTGDLIRGQVAPDGRHLLVEHRREQEWRVYDLAGAEATHTYLGLNFAAWTPDGLGFMAFSPTGDALTYTRLDGTATASPYVPAVPHLSTLGWLGDGTAIFVQRALGAPETQLGVMRPGQMPFAVRQDTMFGDAILVP